MNDFRPPTEHLVSEEEETQTMSPPADAVAVPADAIPVDQEEEVETEEVVEQPTQPPTEPLKPREERQADYDAKLNEQYQNLFGTKAVENANESKAKLERLQKEQSDYDKEQSERRKRKQNEELINSESYKKQLEKGGYITKQFDYKHVEITHPDGRVESHPYSEINKHYGDVDEYVKRWRGKAKIVDKTPPEEKEQVTALDPDVQARLDKEEKERKDEIKRLEKYLSDRDADIADYEVHNKYKDEYVKSKELMTTLNSIDENSDRTKKIAANEVFGSIRDKIESDLWGTLGEEDALTIVLPTIAKDPESESSKEYMQKYFNNDKEFYEKFAEYITSEGETFDYDYIKKIDPQGIPRHIQAAKDKEQELFFIENEYNPKQRRATSQFIIEHTLGPDALDPFKNYHNQQISDFQNLNYGDAKTRDAFGLLQDKKLAMQGQFYGHGELGEMGTAGQYSSASPLTRAEQKAFITQEYEKLKATNTKIEEDISQLNTDKQIFEQELAPYTERQNKAAKRIKEIESMGISKDSPPELINEYNSLINEIKAVQTELTDLGFVERETKLLDRVKLIQNQQDVAMHQASKINDLNAIVKVGLKNFSNVDRTMLQLETAFLGTGSMTLSSAAKGITYGITELGKATDLVSDEEAADWMDHASKIKGASVDYNRQLQNTLEEKYVSTLTTDDVSWTNLDTYAAQLFANNSPSILTIAMTGGAGTIGSLAFKGGSQTARLLTANAIRQSTRGSQAIFFNMGYGGKMAELEITGQNAVNRKKTVADALESGFFPNTTIPLTEYQRQQFENELTELNRQVSMPQWQRTTSSLIAGVSDMYMEKLGSLSYVNKFTRIAPVAGASTFKKMMYGGLNATLNVGTEFGEELGVQLINNASDIVLLGEDKSLLDGVNKDFFANTAFTSLAIQGPGMGGNAYNIIADEVKNQSDRQRSLKRRNELIEIEDLIRQNRTTMSQSDVKDLVDRKREILEQEALDDVMTVQKVARMSDQEKADLFELNRKRRSALKDIRAEAAKGNNKVAQQQKNKLVQKFKKIDAQRNELLGREAKARQEKAKENFDPAQYEHNMGLNDFYTDLVEMNQRQNGNKFRRFTEANPPTVENLTRDGYSQEDADAIISSYKSGSNAANIGNDVLIFQDNIDVNMANTQNATESEVAAVSPMHELLHIQNRNAGIVKDGEVVSQAKIAINQLEQTMDTKLATGRITQEQFDNFKQRKDLYTTKDGVDVEELLNIYGDFVSIGALTASDLNPMYGIKNTLSSLVNKFNPTNQSWLMPMKTGKDVFGYLNNFQKSARNMKVSGVVDQEEKEVRESLAQEASQRVQELYDQQGEAAAMDIIDQFKPIVNKIVDKRKEAPGFDRQLLTDEIETGERGLFDLIRSYDPDSGIPLAAYINKFLPSRAIEASKRVLGEQFEEDVAEAKGVVAEEQDVETVEQKPETAIK